jgi:hypothetical protein
VIKGTNQKSYLHLWPGGFVKMLNQGIMTNNVEQVFLVKVGMCMQANWTPPSSHKKKVLKK